MSLMFDWTVKVTDLVMVVAVLAGPIAAVGITLWAQTRNEKRATRLRLFLALMGERQALVVSQETARSLNTIDVVFAGCAPVIQAWHLYYASLHQQPNQGRVHAWLELLTAMAGLGAASNG